MSRLQLRHRGVAVALEEVRTGAALAGLRFYAEPGDRWSATAVDVTLNVLYGVVVVKLYSRQLALGNRTVEPLPRLRR